jgi:hypothetical protein
VAGTAVDDVVNLSQLTSSVISRTVTAALTLALTDVGKLIVANSSAYATAIVCTVPTNASVAIPVGSFVDILSGDKGPVTLTAAGGVTINGTVPIFGGGGSARLIKVATDTWRVVNVSQSPPPLLRRNIKVGSDNTLTSGFFVTMRLDSPDTPSQPYSNNQDSLGANEQWSSANNTRCYCRRSGYYTVNAQATYGGGVGNRFFINPFFNGNVAADYLGAGISRDAHLDTTAMFSALIPITVGDYMEVACYQDGSGTAPTIQRQTYVPSFVEWKWERPL